MSETLRVILTQFTDETITITLLFLIFVFALLFAYWLYNKRKFQKLTHQIPASVVKNYLDSIIQNSTALKSSLFRGGGIEAGDGIPSVLPLQDLASGGVSSSGASQEEVNQKNAEIASLRNNVADKDKIIADLEKQLEQAKSLAGADGDEQVGILQKEVTDLQAKNKALEDELAAAKAAAASAGSGGGADPAALDAITKERDDLKERLAEYEIIEEDLANLKRLQQENEQLKKTIEQLGGEAPAAAAPAEAAPAPAAEPEPAAEEPAAEAAPVEEPAAEEPAAEAAAPPADVPENEGEQKSAEELLSEFEKMLG